MEEQKNNDLDVREKLKEHLFQVNSYLSECNLITKTKKFLFSNDYIFKFITHPHLSIPKDVKKDDNGINKGLRKNVNKGNTEFIKFPELKESYLNYEIQNILKDSDIDFDPFYFIWKKHIDLYYKELSELTWEYFNRLSEDKLYKFESNYIKLFIYYNNKVVKLLRREQLIFALMGKNSSIIRQLREKKEIWTLYFSLRCNWIDDNGDIDRTVRIPLSELSIDFDENPGINYKDVPVPDYTLSDRSEMLYSLLKSEGCFKLSIDDEEPSKTEYIIKFDNNKEYNLDFGKTHLTDCRVFSLMEYAKLSEIFKELYKENYINSIL